MNAVSNKLKEMLLRGQINFATDTIKACLMQETFVFDRDAHAEYKDVYVWELASGHGYEMGGQILTPIEIGTDLIQDLAFCKFGNIAWIATGGILVVSGVIIYDDTPSIATGAMHDKPVIMYLDAGGVHSAVDGTALQITDIKPMLR